MPQFRRHRVESHGLSLAAREYGAGAGRAHVVLVHGFPDDQSLWEPVAQRLADEFHVVTYDVRGAGASDTPPSQDGYRIELLVEDLIAVVDALVPAGEPFHLVGHDWGSVQAWDAVAAERRDARLRGRIASYTTLSGPSLDHVAALYRRGTGRRLRLARQALHSWYVYAFHVPRIPEMVWTRRPRLVARLVEALDRRAGHGHWNPQLGQNAANGLNLYRANVRRRMISPGNTSTDLPVKVIVATRDRFVTPVFYEDLSDYCSDLTRVEVDGGHWLPRSQPEVVADEIAGHARAHPVA